MPTFHITPRAEESLKEIGRYTLKKWGKKQRNIYLQDIDKRFQWLAENPLIGKHRADIEEGYYCFRQGEHLIFYVIQQSDIAIIGVPHCAMDIQNYFGIN